MIKGKQTSSSLARSKKKADVIGAKLSFDTEVTCPLFFQLIKKPKNPRAHFLLYMKNKIERTSFFPRQPLYNNRPFVFHPPSGSLKETNAPAVELG